jgi:hypothetical protein
MEIVLLRHGMPEIIKNRWLTAAEFGLWISEYNAAGINLGCMPSNDLIGRAGRCSFIVCSHLPRSMESAKVLKVNNIDLRTAVPGTGNAAWKLALSAVAGICLGGGV